MKPSPADTRTIAGDQKRRTMTMSFLICLLHPESKSPTRHEDEEAAQRHIHDEDPKEAH